MTFGETMASARSTGSLRAGDPLTLSVAGAESNVAIGLARLGHTVSWVGRVGHDEFGELILRTLRAESVDLSGVVADRTAPTGAMFSESLLGDLSRVQYYRARSAGSRLTSDDVVGRARGADIVHVSGITPALSVSASQATNAAIAAAREAGAYVSFDVNYRSKLWSRQDATETLTRLAHQASLVVASADELDLVAGPGAPADQAAALLEAGVKEVAVKLGGDGAQVYTAQGHWTQHAIPVRVVDTIGAGDAFTAGYLSGVIDGERPAARLKRGCLLGAFAVSARGDWAALPSREALELAESGLGADQR
jgi:2-dehydro-3-deoxygluconokinase